jgi:sec-independent protein translocase protein TatA
MFGLSGQHLFLFLIFLAIVLIIFGPGKLPDVGAGLGKAIREFRHASNEVKDTVVNSTASPVEDAPAPAPPAAPTEPTLPVAGSSTKTRVGG